jgi:hypothetical protein
VVYSKNVKKVYVFYQKSNAKATVLVMELAVLLRVTPDLLLSDARSAKLTAKQFANVSKDMKAAQRVQ